MEKQVVRLRKAYPNTLLLFECGYRMRIFGKDAENAAAVLDIRAQQHKNFLETSVPVHRTLFHARRLVHAGFKVGVVKQMDSVAMRAVNKAPGAQRKPLERCVTDIYTRATIPELENCGDDSEEEDTIARFIACIVEETIHSKPFFSQSMHEVDEETKRSPVFSEDVRIGIFMHDIHTGESKFDEFEDDGKRQRLQRTLETLDPVEFVLPAGRLSAYTEQIVDTFVAISDETSVIDDRKATVRMERIPNEAFDYSAAKETFTRAFHEAGSEYTTTVAYPNLPKMCVCCFGGMWQYLSSLGTAQTLIAPTYTSLSSPTSTFAGQFHLPTEAYRDLDLFVNSTTKRGVGSLLSILNHTKTSAGARKLRDWIRSPLVDVQEIAARQKTIESLAFPSGSLSTESIPHRLAYEELTTTILPRSKHLLKYLQQVHLGKATPSQAVGALQILQDLEDHIHGLKATFASITDVDQTTVLDRLLEGYPTLQARLTPLLDEVDVKYAQPSLARKYRAFTRELETLAREYDAVLVTCRSALRDPLLEYSTFRGGSLSDIHHLIEVKRSDLHVVPQDWLVVNSTTQLVRFHPKQIIQLHIQEEFVKQQKEQLVRALWRQFVSEVDAQVYVTGMACVDILANLDALCSLATVAQSYPNYTKPQFVDDDVVTLEINDGRHPIIEMLLEGSSYISNSVLISSTAGSLMVVSGPNMGGKTSLLRMCALVVILAQIGSFVPASSVRLSVFDGVYTLMHRSTSKYSSCAQELTTLGSISRNATKNSLVLIDEIGFGMAAQYAEAVAVGQMTYLTDTAGCLVVFATHLTAATEKLLARLGDKCQTRQLEYHFYDQEEADAHTEIQDVVTFHYVLKDGVASDSVAIETARRAGIASAILARATELIGSL
ncbi:DNA mismatch repair protein Msh3, putative [Phytophthora infestans T30-4]|uniref:DNA mismatch repair protein Msh3, putative n=1 Tax=Phytophthora infestans (strain T30-4) TaxID=403677 RepID=D0NGP3_PHYIT|nr:DNA mismatch repair protein Msh3, putative [Phytophthora infestans T30-4]EEY57444.1 DNA mismatch repair protein Msh3, putative [Phytophthora infestans T30-4]|eukprot:XP_002902054.1 DNA mismatch repair protein Msh3, putative [Phytophthora infestans T30-4]